MNKTKDMTVGSPTKTIFFFSVPVLLGTLFQQIYNMADTIIVGQFLGEDALAAVGATGSTVYLVIGFASGLTQGCGILVSQAFGGHRLKELKKVVGTALLLTVVFSVILTIPTVSFSRQILLALHTPSNVLLYAHEYLRVIFGGILCTMAYNIAASILRSLGDSRTPLYFLILSSFLNIVLDIFFIATLHMGTAGAAWATVLSQGISALLCFWYMFHNYNNLRLSIRDLYPDPYRILCMIQSGIPMALNQTVTAFGIMILQSGINQFGSSVMAAYTAASKLESLVMQPMIALGSGISTYCAQNIGARKTKRIFVGVRSTMLLSLGAAILGMALYGIASKAILRIFLSDPSPEMGTLCTAISLHKRVVPFIFGMDFSVPQCFGWARERPYHHNWWRGRASLPFFMHSFSASTFWFLVYLSNQSYYLDRCVQPFLRILFSLGTPAKTLLKKCEMIHLRRLSGSLPVDFV